MCCCLNLVSEEHSASRTTSISVWSVMHPTAAPNILHGINPEETGGGVDEWAWSGNLGDVRGLAKA